jgi:tRNA threonylcarbamoyladenosine biosynthesis protein TsaE
LDHAVELSARAGLGYGRPVSDALPLTRHLAGPDDTRAAGEALGACLGPGDVVGLIGDLGAGKTLLVQGVAAGLGVPAGVRVVSPTFTLVNEYRGGRVTLFHADLYRIEKAAELEQIGLDEQLGGAGAVAVEWSDRFAILPGDHLEIRLADDGDGRVLTATGRGANSADLLARWSARLAG